MKHLLLTLLLFSNWTWAQVEEDKKEVVGTISEPSDQERKKAFELLKMKDQSESGWVETHYTFNVSLGRTAVLADTPAQGFGEKSVSSIFGISLDYQMMPDFLMGGFFDYASHADFFSEKINVWGLGLQMKYKVGKMFYVGAKGGLKQTTYQTHLNSSFSWGPSMGFIFPMSSQFAAAVEINLLWQHLATRSFSEFQILPSLSWSY